MARWVKILLIFFVMAVSINAVQSPVFYLSRMLIDVGGKCECESQEIIYVREPGR